VGSISVLPAVFLPWKFVWLRGSPGYEIIGTCNWDPIDLWLWVESPTLSAIFQPLIAKKSTRYPQGNLTSNLTDLIWVDWIMGINWGHFSYRFLSSLNFRWGNIPASNGWHAPPSPIMLRQAMPCWRALRHTTPYCCTGIWHYLKCHAWLGQAQPKNTAKHGLVINLTLLGFKKNSSSQLPYIFFKILFLN